MKKWITVLFLVVVLAFCLYAQPGPIQPLITNLTQFKNQTAWRLFYSNTDGDVTELALGANTTVLTSNGATSAPTWGAAGAGDITQVWDTASGDVATPTIESGEYLDGGTATVDAAGEGILLPRGADVSAATAEGQISWDSDNDLLYVGDGAAVVSIAGSFDSTAVDATTWSDNANASNIWTFDVSGTDHTMTAGNGVMTFSHAVTISGTITGDLTGAITGNADTATVATTVTITDNEATAENNPIVFVAGADPDGGNLGLETDGTTYYNPSTGTITATEFVGGGSGLTLASTDLSDTADIIYETELDDFAELQTQISDKTLVNTADGATWLGVHTFGGATTVIPWKVNTTAAPTVEGQAIWESDTDELTVGDGSVSVVIAAKTNTVFCFNIHDIDSGMDDIKMPFTRAVTITKVTAFVTGGTNVVGRLYEVDGDGDDSDAVGVESSDWTFTAGETEDSSFNNATFDAGDYIQWDTTSVSGSVTGFMISVEGYEI